MSVSLALLGVASAQEAQAGLDRRIADVAQRAQAGECRSALYKLNPLLRQTVPEAQLLAAVLYEHGRCVRVDFERALNFYTRAADAGESSAAGRLVGLLAERKDYGAAIWWAHQLPRILPSECYVYHAPINEAEPFAAALDAWPKGRLEACAYTAGVIFTVYAWLRFPANWPMLVGGADLNMEFIPAKGQLTWTQQRTEASETQIAVMNYTSPAGEEQLVSARTVLPTHARTVSDAVLARFTPPQGIPAHWRVSFRFRFVTE
jgi:hypothetical protein